jgi:hypothetical protein
MVTANLYYATAVRRAHLSVSPRAWHLSAFFMQTLEVLRAVASVGGVGLSRPSVLPAPGKIGDIPCGCCE